MTPESAFLAVMRDFRDRLDAFNEIEGLCGLPALEDQRKSFGDRAVEILIRAEHLRNWARGDDIESAHLAADALGALLVSFKLALLREAGEAS